MIQKVKRKSGAKKKFFDVKIPLTATKVSLYGYSKEELQNSVVKLDLTKNLRGKNLDLRAKVKLQDDELIGEIISLQLLPSYIFKIMRRGTDYIEDSFEISCKDSRLRIKPFMIARKRVSREIRKTIRNAARKFIESHTTIRTSREVFSDVMSNKLQREISLKVKKIYPLALCEIRMIEIVSFAAVKSKEEKPIESKTE